MNLMTYVDRLEALSVREQILTGATLVAFVISLLQFFLVDPLLVRQDALNRELKVLDSTNERQQRLLDGDQLTPSSTRKALLSAEIASLEWQLKEHETEIDAYTSTLVPARKMPALLQALLEKESVHLVSLVNLPPISLLLGESFIDENIDASVENATEPGVQLFAHGIQLELRGDFHMLRRYLQAVEHQPWGLLWQSVRLETEASGESVMQLQLQTLSTDSAWLGV